MGADDISDEEVRRDIADTEAEIATMQRELIAFRMLGDRLSQFKADARVDGMRKRGELITKLERILAERLKGVRDDHSA